MQIGGMKEILKFLLDHKYYLNPSQVRYVTRGMEKLNLGIALSQYEINEFCQLKVLIELKLELPS